MGNDFIYVPVLKSKQGERKAVKELKNATRSTIKPLFEADVSKVAQISEIEAFIKAESAAIKKESGCGAIFYDAANLTLFESNSKSTGEIIKNCFDGEGIDYTPCIALEHIVDQLMVADQFTFIVENGLCLRFCPLGDVENSLSNLQDIINQSLFDLGNTDLIIDLTSIRSNDLNSLKYQLFYILGRIPNINAWRSIILSSSAFAKDFTGIKNFNSRYDARNDWNVWKQISNEWNGRELIFSDHGVAHPITTDFIPGMTIPVTLRYTLAEEWWLIKAGVTKSGGAKTFKTICEQLSASHHYSGKDFSWGDNLIHENLTKQNNFGNATTWRQIGFNHHIEFAVDQITNSDE